MMTLPSSLKSGCVNALACFTASLMALIPVLMFLQFFLGANYDKKMFFMFKRKIFRLWPNHLSSCARQDGHLLFVKPAYFAHAVGCLYPLVVAVQNAQLRAVV